MEQPLDVGAPRRARHYLAKNGFTADEPDDIIRDLLGAYEILSARYAHLVVAITGAVEE